MNFDLPEDIVALRDGAREFAEKELAPRAAASDEAETFVAEQWKACGEQGWAGLSIPEAYGGAGLGEEDLATHRVTWNATIDAIIGRPEETGEAGVDRLAAAVG